MATIQTAVDSGRVGDTPETHPAVGDIYTNTQTRVFICDVVTAINNGIYILSEI